jgi:hypothetical protein
VEHGDPGFKQGLLIFWREVVFIKDVFEFHKLTHSNGGGRGRQGPKENVFTINSIRVVF